MAFETAGLRSVGDVLKGFSFQIPTYQRGYAWQKLQWEEFWQDICNAQRAVRPHFLGTLMTSQKGALNGIPVVDIVDGQQRIVTTIIALNCISKRVGLQPNRISLSYPGRDVEEAFFRRYGLGESVKSAVLAETSSYALNIKSAWKYFDALCSDIAAPDKLADVRRLILDQMHLFVLEVSRNFDIHVAFETLNNRGKALSSMELLKNRLMYLTTLMQGDVEALRGDIHDTWKGIYTWLGKSVKTQGHDDEFLKAHATAFYRTERKAEWLRGKLFGEEFSSNNPRLDESLVRNYISSLEQAAGWWAHIHNWERLPPSHQKQLERLDRSGFAYFKPLVLAAYMRATRVEPDAAASPLDYEGELAPVARLLEEVERYVLVVFRLAGKRGSFAKSEMDTCAHALMSPGQGITVDGKNLDAMADGEAIQFVTDFIEAAVDNRDIEPEVARYPQFDWDGYVQPKDILKAVDDRMRKGGSGYYNWEFARLVLFEYEDSFRDGGKNAPKIHWEEFAFDDTVEHIYPQTPDNVEYWKKMISIDGRSDKTGQVSRCAKNSLGNLLLLSRSANSKLQNQAFRDRKEEQKVDIYKNASYSATEVATVFDDWRIESIAARGVAILKFAEQRWRVELSEQPEDPISYLPLCFGADMADKLRRGKGIRFSHKRFSATFEKIPVRRVG